MRSAAAERDVRVLGAADVERERVVENVFVAVGGAQHRDHAVALGDGDAIHLHVDLRAARPERDGGRPAQHLLDRARSDRLVGAIALDLLRVGDERLKSRGQRVLRGVAAGERDDEEEDLQFIGRNRQLLAVLVGHDRRGQRAPDVIGGVAPLLRGELERIGEYLSEQLHGVLLGSGIIRGGDLQDAIECLEDLRPVLVGNADDVADDRHREHVGDVGDPVAAAGRKQSVDHRRGAPANALLELGDRLRREGVGHHPPPLDQVRRVHVDDGRR